MSELNKENKKSTAGKVPVWVFVLVLVVLLGGAYMLSEQRMATTDDESRTDNDGLHDDIKSVHEKHEHAAHGHRTGRTIINKKRVQNG